MYDINFCFVPSGSQSWGRSCACQLPCIHCGGRKWWGQGDPWTLRRTPHHQQHSRRSWWRGDLEKNVISSVYRQKKTCCPSWTNPDLIGVSTVCGKDVKLMCLLTWVVNTSLDDIIHCVPSGGLLVPKLGIHFLSQHLGHVVVMLGKVWILIFNWIVQLEVVVGVSERHDCVSNTAHWTKRKWERFAFDFLNFHILLPNMHVSLVRLCLWPQLNFTNSA